MKANLSGLLVAALACLASAVLLPSARAQDKYKSFEEARSEGGRLVRNRQYAEAQEPLEAALRLAPDDKARLSVYQALVPAYRTLPEIDKLLEANEFIIRHSDRSAGRSLPARDVASFLHQRGKVDVGIERYEAQLKKDPDDIAALSILSIIYTRLKRDEARGQELARRQAEVDRKIAQRVAEKLEKEAEASPNQAASHLKDAAQLWLEAGEKAKAVATAKRSAGSPPEKRSELLTFYWHDGLGDVFLATAEPKLAVEQFEAALAVARDFQRKAAEKKLAEAKAAAILK